MLANVVPGSGFLSRLDGPLSCSSSPRQLHGVAGEGYTVRAAIDYCAARGTLGWGSWAAVLVGPAGVAAPRASDFRRWLWLATTARRGNIDIDIDITPYPGGHHARVVVVVGRRRGVSSEGRAVARSVLCS